MSEYKNANIWKQKLILNENLHYRQGRLKTIGGPGLILKWGPYFSNFFCKEKTFGISFSMDQYKFVLYIKYVTWKISLGAPF